MALDGGADGLDFYRAVTQKWKSALRLGGTLIFEEGRLAGYLYVTLCYSAEVGGTCVFIEEVYLLPEFRGRGLGRQVLEWIFTQYPDSRRFRLEVTQMNQGAAHLYEKCGFQYLRYDQMVLDR